MLDFFVFVRVVIGGDVFSEVTMSAPGVGLVGENIRSPKL
jgi:hypothetical protein